MSLDDWNLSSDEEEGFDEWANGTSLNDFATKSKVAAHNASLSSSDDESSDDEEEENKNSHMTVSFFGEGTGEGTNGDEDADDEDDEIDWEDAEGDEGDGATNSAVAKGGIQSPATVPKPVTVEIAIGKSKNKPQHAKSSTQRRQKRKRARRSYRHEHLAPDLQRFLVELQKTHLLALVAHAIKASSYCCEEEVLCVSHSILPTAWLSQDNGSSKANHKQAPTLQELGHFCNYFFALVRKKPMMTGGGYNSRYRNKKAPQNNKKSNGYYPNATTMHYRTTEYCSYLGSSDRARNVGTKKKTGLQSPTFNCYDKVHLLISLVRSKGWRARYVIAFEPTKKDLDVNHPIFVAMGERHKNVFQRVWYASQKKKKKAKKTTEPEVVDLTNDTSVASLPNKDDEDMDSKPAAKPSIKSTAALGQERTETETATEPGYQCWIEILCHTTTTTTTKEKSSNGGGAKSNNNNNNKYQWIPVDPRFELVNQPQSVEGILYSDQNELPFSSSSKKKVPISYALASEHISDSRGKRLTDVTPRYSSSWTETLKKRGVLRGKQTRVKEGLRVDKWWKSVLQGNHPHHNQNATAEKRKALCDKGKSAKDAILLDDEHLDEVGKKKKVMGSSSSSSRHKSTMEVLDDHDEENELTASAKKEPIPTSKTAFKSHPIYVIPSVMNANEVLVPDAKKRFCGIFKGEMVFRRTDVEQALPERKWLYRGRKVRVGELSKPIKRIKARKKPATQGFKALRSYGVGETNDGGEDFQQKQLEHGEAQLEDGKENIYASWQTDNWSPPFVGPNDPLPVNEYKNIELELLNPGLVHVQLERIAKLAKRLGIPYAPCLLGFEGHGGNRTPTIRGIVVHVHNEQLLREAHAEMSNHQLEEDRDNYEKAIWKKWKRLLEGVLIRDRLEREYGDGEG